MNKTNYKVLEYLRITIGVIIVSLGFYFFFSPMDLVTGGVTGSSILFVAVTGLDAVWGTVFMYTLNIILLIIGGLALGKSFFIKTVYGTLLLPSLILLYQYIFSNDAYFLNQVNESSRLFVAAICGAALTGSGLGLVFKYNATTGGTDVLQQILFKKAKVPYSVALYLTDGVIIGLGFLKFGFQNTFYAILALLIAGLVVDKIILSGKSGYTAFIVTNEYEAIKNAIYSKINRGITHVPVMGGFSETHKDMILCTVSRNQLYRMKEIVAELDPTAFTIITKTTESVGLGFNNDKNS